MQEPKPGGRIVSQSEYAKAQWMRFVFIVSGLFLLALTVFCGFATVVLIGTGPLCLLVGWVTYLCGKGGIASIRQAQDLEEVQPISYTDTVALRASETLVRASSEPAQAQEAVLLRAATADTQPGAEGQLLRASIGGE